MQASNATEPDKRAYRRSDRSHDAHKRKHNACSNISRRSKPFLAALIVLSLAASMVAISSSSSARAYASQSVSYNCGRTIYYGDDGWFTHFMDCDGAYAYCVQPRSKVPANGSYQKDALSQTNSSTNNIRALLWFGYGGPGFDRNMWPQYYSDGSIMHDDLYYVLTHVILTNYYSYEDASTSLKGLSQSERRWLSANIMPLDDASFGFGGGNDDTFAGRCFARSAEVPETFECFSINSGTPSTS